jgi:putative transposase
MKRSRFSEQQIAFVLRQAEVGTTVEEVCRTAGISEATYYVWRKKYGGLMPSEMRRLKQLEEENSTLKKLVADLSLDKEMLRLALAIDARYSYRGADVVATLDQAAQETGYPKIIRLDNGPEFISKELDLWAFMHDVTLDFGRPGKPTDNAFIESLNGKFRAECLNTHWFMSIDEARRKCEAWRRD